MASAWTVVQMARDNGTFVVKVDYISISVEHHADGDSNGGYYYGVVGRSAMNVNVCRQCELDRKDSAQEDGKIEIKG